MKTADENATDHYNVCSLFMNAVFCEESLRKNHDSHTKMLIVFGMGRSTNFNYFLKACQISKVYVHSCKTKKCAKHEDEHLRCCKNQKLS